MKLSIVTPAILLSVGVLFARTVSADSTLESAIKVNERPLPSKLKTFVPKGARLLRTGTAAAVEKGGWCWLVFTEQSQKTARGTSKNVVLQVLQPVANKKWKQLGRQILPMAAEDSLYASLNWLNVKQKRGFVIGYTDGEDTNLIAFPDGWASKRQIMDTFTSGSTSIYATSYGYGGVDKRGFMTVTKTYSEPAMDEDGNTITREEQTDYFWNGNGW